MKTITKVNAIECPNCKDIIYSRAQHDFHYCSCGEIAVDGGFEYLKICFNGVPPRHVLIMLNTTKQQLYDDWNHGKNKFGVIKPL